MRRTINHAEDTLRIDNLNAVVLLGDCLMGTEWEWNYKGLVRVLPLPTMWNVLRGYMDFMRAKNRRESLPSHVGVFHWAQTVSVTEENTDEPLHPGSADETSGSGNPNQ